MTDILDSDFQVTIISSPDVPAADGPRFDVNRHSRRSGVVVQGIDDLESIWDQVIAKLTGLAAKSKAIGDVSEFELDQIEFNIGIEAGLSVGLVTKANASVSITFSRKKPDKQGA